MNTPTQWIDIASDKVSRWIGSTASLITHTIFFLIAFVSHWLFGWAFGFILLVLTTAVSLEAIYISIFIQRSVNQQGVRLEEVEESLDDVEEALDDVEEGLDEVEEGLDDVEKSLARRSKAKNATHEQVLTDLQDTAKKIEALVAALKEK